MGHWKARSDAKLRTRKATEGYVWLGESSSGKQRWHGVKRVAEHAEILLPREIADGTGAQQELAAALVQRQLPTRLSGGSIHMQERPPNEEDWGLGWAAPSQRLSGKRPREAAEAADDAAGEDVKDMASGALKAERAEQLE